MDKTPGGGDMQDGMLAWYQSQAVQSDSAVERRLEREPFDFHDELIKQQISQGESFYFRRKLRKPE